jgi:hypothetical protein
MSLLFRLAFFGFLLAAPAGALAQDAIVGSWAGDVVQGEQSFKTLVTIVSPRGGVSRYLSGPCGGILSGGRKGDAYEYSETITWGGTEEKEGGCINGTVRFTVDGDTLKYDWSGNYNGQDYAAAGELHRVRKDK